MTRSVLLQFGSVCALLGLLGGLGQSCARNPKTPAVQRDIAPLTAASARETTTPPKLPPAQLFASKNIAKVRVAPNKDAARLGYMRTGALATATTNQPLGYEDCRGGWYELDQGGFVCATTDMVAYRDDKLPARRPLQPDLKALLPYPYVYSRTRDTPVYRRPPSDEEAARHEAPRPAAELVAVEASLDASRRATIEAAARAEALHGPGVSATPIAAPPEPEPAPPPTLASLQGERGGVLLRRMERGFYVSLDRDIEKGTRTYVQTQAAGYIPKARLVPVVPSQFHGVDLEQTGWTLPLGFVISKHAKVHALDAKGRLRAPREPEYHFAFPIASQVEIGRKSYFVAHSGDHYLAGGVTVAQPRERPREVHVDEKWIDVDLGSQTLVAYVGDKPVYVTAISSGRIKDELDPLRNFQTPTGMFRIASKHLSTTMDGDHALDGPYSIEDVPYVMYFSLAYALHSAFWHDSFGRPHSHGCVNLAPADARWLFSWTEPQLPTNWHGVYSADKHSGTRVYIRGETPRG